jgi:hypothetical protein
MKCPACGHEQSFRIVGKTMFTVTDDGTEDHGDVEWNDDSYAECPECQRHGTLKDFEVTALPPTGAAKLTTAQLQTAKGISDTATTESRTRTLVENLRDIRDDMFWQEDTTGVKVTALPMVDRILDDPSINAALAQALILDLVVFGLMTLHEGEAEFDGVMYWFDARQPDWCKGVVDAIGWDTARAAVAQATS